MLLLIIMLSTVFTIEIAIGFIPYKVHVVFVMFFPKLYG